MDKNEVRRLVGEAQSEGIHIGQNTNEAISMCEILQELKPSVILEVGIHSGGTLNMWSKFATPDALLIGIDLHPEYHLLIRDRIGSKPQRFEFVEGRSQDNITIKKVAEILEDKKIDFLFIDGDHRSPVFKLDFKNYAPFVREQGIVAFHDIETTHGGFEKIGYFVVEELKKYFNVQTICAHDNMGIGYFYFSKEKYDLWLKERGEIQ